MKTGILLHVYNLLAADWEYIVWGDPARDALGAGTKLFECMLAELPPNDVTAILYDGPSHKDGLSEGEYTKRFLLGRLDQLEQFPRFRKQFASMSDDTYRAFRQAAEAMRIGAPIANTVDEVRRAARDFADLGAEKVIHIAAASHAPRCIQVQAAVREEGLILPEQHWYTVASDTAFAGAQAADTAVAEPPHRADDPLLGFRLTMPQIVKSFYALPGDAQKVFLRVAADLVAAQSATAKTEEPRHAPSASLSKTV